MRRALGLANPSMESCAGLAEVLLAQVKPGEAAPGAASAAVEEILEHLSSGSLEGTIDPCQLYLPCSRVLQGIGDSRGPEILHQAHWLLQARAAKILAVRARICWLDSVPTSRLFGARAMSGIPGCMKVQSGARKKYSPYLLL